ncbi:MAG: hypothetical protein EOM80_00315 [Erysipelotrichia bacterium]|nr:hypothetical protein [Erysipelotrichia bacterium]
MHNRNLSVVLLLALMLVVSAVSYGVSPEFAALHRESIAPDRNIVLKKVLFLCGQVNAAYHGINDMVAALQLAKENKITVEMLQAQLLAVKIGLVEKPALIRHIAKEIEFCESYPNFPLGFPDSPEGCEKISAEFFKIADHIDNLPINHQLKDLAALRKEAQKVVFELFWTDGEKMRTLSMDMLNFLRLELKEDIPFDVFGKPHSH